MKLLPSERIILALDRCTMYEAKKAVDELAPYVGTFKIGLGFIGMGLHPQLIEHIHASGRKTFLDGKFHDTPEQVGAGSAAAAHLKVGMFTVHCSGGAEMMYAAVASRDSAWPSFDIADRPKMLGVTVLTSLDHQALRIMGICRTNARDPQLDDRTAIDAADALDIQKMVSLFAFRAMQMGLDGVVASANEAAGIRKTLGPDFLIVTPGIRPTWEKIVSDDQKRTATPAEAIRAGSDCLVIGRPIMENDSPSDAAKRIADEIESASE